MATNRGFSIVEVLIGSAILITTIAAFATVLDHMNRSSKGLVQKLELIQAQLSLSGEMANPEICACNFDPTKNTSADPADLRFDSTSLSTSSVRLTTMYSSCIAGVPGNPTIRVGQQLPGTLTDLNVTNVTLKNITQSGTSYRGDLVVDLDPTKMVFARNPITVKINFTADLTNPVQAKISSCTTASLGSSGSTACPAEIVTFNEQYYPNAAVTVRTVAGLTGLSIVPTCLSGNCGCDPTAIPAQLGCNSANGAFATWCTCAPTKASPSQAIWKCSKEIVP